MSRAKILCEKSKAGSAVGLCSRKQHLYGEYENNFAYTVFLATLAMSVQACVCESWF